MNFYLKFTTQIVILCIKYQFFLVPFSVDQTSFDDTNTSLIIPSHIVPFSFDSFFRTFFEL